MGYMKIPNTYKDPTVLKFREVYALEKVHGTSANIQWSNGKLSFYSGGETHSNFVALFDQARLFNFFKGTYSDNCVVRIHGEAYGGKQQGMSRVYGPTLHFIVFDINVNGKWLDVPNAHDYAEKLGLEFIPYELVSSDIDKVDAERDRDSIVAIRRGMGTGHIREGVVLRPPFELIMNNGERCMAKHKREEFREHKSPRPIVDDPAKLAVLEEAEAIADEWCVPMRLQHVLGHLTKDGVEPTIERMGDIIKAMITDIYVEAGDEIKRTKEAEKAIGTKTVGLYKQYLKQRVGL